MSNKTRNNLKQDILDTVEILLEFHHNIPVSKKIIKIDGLGEMSYKVVSKDNDEYFIYTANKTGDYLIKKVKKEEVYRTIVAYYNSLNKNDLQSELEYLNECVKLFTEEDNIMMFSAQMLQFS